MKNKVLQQLWKIVCKVRVLFATVAFWMGVYILHIHQIFCPLVPWSIEGYYQKISRAGQDGRKAIARLFFNGSKQAIRRHDPRNECLLPLLLKVFKTILDELF